ncbi:hypothetical protein LWI29_027759 [Acer saccharum]|uniref:Uncharacterized protein n=1 Tax=Acer saccharum TaxID=4024 RepID=A0AA39S123_ACESA|nr:hypothetical protein LWI29_027759 [Acer saccharum]
MLHVDLARLDQITPQSRGQRGTSSPISRSVRGRTNLSQHQTPIPSRAHSESRVPSSSRRSSVDPLDMLQCMSAGKGYVGEGYWNDSRIPSSFEQIRAVFNNGVYAVEELTWALISQERQASEISRLRRELAEKNDVLKSASVSESKIKQGFEERLRQWEVTEDVLRKILAIV